MPQLYEGGGTAFCFQPALSRHIKNMEEELNIQLFVRTSNGIRLTPAGSSLYVGMADMYSNYNEMVQKAEKIQKGLSGTLKIGILDQTNVGGFYAADLPQFPGGLCQCRSLVSGGFF